MKFIAKNRNRLQFTKEVPIHVIDYYNSVLDYYYNHPDGGMVAKWIDIHYDNKNDSWKLVLKSNVPDNVVEIAERLANGLEKYLRELYEE